MGVCFKVPRAAKSGILSQSLCFANRAAFRGDSGVRLSPGAASPPQHTPKKRPWTLLFFSWQRSKPLQRHCVVSEKCQMQTIDTGVQRWGLPGLFGTQEGIVHLFFSSSLLKSYSHRSQMSFRNVLRYLQTAFANPFSWFVDQLGDVIAFIAFLIHCVHCSRYIKDIKHLKYYVR